MYDEYDVENACYRFEAKLTALNEEADLFLEKKDTRSIFTKLRQFISRLIASIISFKNDLKNSIDMFIKKKNLEKNLANLKEQALILKRSGKAYINCPDFNAYAARMQSYIKEVNRLVTKFKSTNYKKAYDVQADLTTFDNATRLAEHDLDVIIKTPKRQNVETVIEFCSHELNKKGVVVQTISSMEKTITDFKLAAAHIEKKAQIMGDDICYLRVGAIQKMTGGLASVVRTFTGALIAKVIYYCGAIF